MNGRAETARDTHRRRERRESDKETKRQKKKRVTRLRAGRRDEVPGGACWRARRAHAVLRS